jgi:hypothetical protein
MSKIFQNDTGIKFLFFTNYKVMNSNLVGMLNQNFPGIKVYMSIDKIREFDGYNKLAIVRNPYDRVLSLFTDKCREHPRKVRSRDNRIWLQKNQVDILKAAAVLFDKHTELVEPEKEIPKPSPLYDQLLDNFEVLESLEFTDFVEITSYLFSLPTMDAHFFPQSWIMMKDGNLVLDEYFRLETINEEWAQVCRLAGKDMVLSDGVNRTNFEGPDKYKKYYNEDMRQVINRLYRIDFENFNYSFD